MTWLDIIITVVFLVFAVLGLMRGLIAEVFSLLSWVFALYVGSHYGEFARPYVESWVTSVKYQGLVACLLVGIITYIVVALIGILLSKKKSAQPSSRPSIACSVCSSARRAGRWSSG